MRSCSGCYYAVLSKNFGSVSCMKAKEIVFPEWGIDCPYYRCRRTTDVVRGAKEAI
jgi:hypothetical protein